jgi:transcriptional regulator with XRE-family HTH domain
MAGMARDEKIDVRRSSQAKPYHYVGAGLPNVYLVGVEYRMERETGLQSADIPCLPGLLDALAKALVEKRAPLTADELRFLRKRLQIASKEFAVYVGLTPEQYSRLENGATITLTVDRLVRLLYAALAKLPADATAEVARTKWSAEMDHAERIIASQDEEHNWIVKTKAA